MENEASSRWMDSGIHGGKGRNSLTIVDFNLPKCWEKSEKKIDRHDD